jgi:hypothetical protein
MYGLINNNYCYLQNEHFLAKRILKNYAENLNLIPIINKNYCQHGYCCKRGWTLKPRLFASLYFSSGRRISIWLLLLTSTLYFQLGSGSGLDVIEYPTCSNTCPLAAILGTTQ